MNESTEIFLAFIKYKAYRLSAFPAEKPPTFRMFRFAMKRNPDILVQWSKE